jgi:hypothetical protein
VARTGRATPNGPFVERFIRPHGLDQPATPRLVEAIERLAARAVPGTEVVTRWAVLLRPVVYALVLAGRLPLVERIFWNPAKFRTV